MGPVEEEAGLTASRLRGPMQFLLT